MPLKFSISIPVLNAAHCLEACLKSIRKQDYPNDLVEVLVADGGSQDETCAIAKKYNARVLPNEKVLAEEGTKVAARHAAGDIFIVFAADNELANKDWLSTAAGMFEQDPKMAALWCKQISGSADKPINRYYELIQNDPLSFFLNSNLGDYLREASITQAGRYRGYKFSVDSKRPLIWGANGLAYRLDLVRHMLIGPEYIGDNDVFQTMAEEGNNQVAYVPELNVIHHHVQSVGQWVKKWKRNFGTHFLGHKDSRNMNWAMTSDFKTRLSLWFLYSGVPVFSGIDALAKMIRDKNIYWVYHPLMSFLQTTVYSCIMISRPEGRKMIGGLLRSNGGHSNNGGQPGAKKTKDLKLEACEQKRRV
ncbi:glycosyltransferase [Elusimicrobiota bacterium]